MRWIIFLLLSFFVFPLSAQIINIEKSRLRSKDSVGWSGNINAGFSVNKNVKTLISLSSSAQLQYKNVKNLYLLLGKIDFVKADADAFVNATFLHFRYNRKLNKYLRWEAFSQIQNNAITLVKFRGLLGTGPRFKLRDTEKFSLYAATLYMFEYDEEGTSSNALIYRQEHRQSSYISLTWRPQKTNFECIATAYYQPLWSNFSDYRILLDLNLKFKIATHLSYSTVVNGMYDAFPAEKIPQTIYSISNRLSWDF